MYTIVAIADGTEYPLHNLKSRRLIVGDPYFEIGDNLNGQAEFNVFKGHPYYDKVRKLTTDIIIRNGSRDVFYGRVLYDDEDSNSTKRVFVEGELAFLCDSIQRPREYHNIGVRDYLINVIKSHNDQVEERKHFTVGRVTVEDANDSLYRIANYQTTRETLKDKLSDRLGGHFVVRHENNVRYLDYLSDDDYFSRCTQQIKFGKNLLSFARNFDATNLATCIIPLGATLEESSIEGLEERLTIKEVNGGKDYITDDAAVKEYGKIYKTIVFDDITLPENLKTKGQKYLTQTQYEKMVLECKAIDLNFTDEAFESFSLGSLVHCVSEPHALDAWYPVTKQKFYLTDFKQNTITLGDESSNVTYTSSNRQDSADFKEDLETYRTGLTERIEKAKSDFKVAIENANGLYSTPVKQDDGSVITYYHNKKDLESSSIRMVFNDAGFAVSNNAGKDWYGIQVDGNFIANIMNAMGVNAGWINTGVLRVTDAKNKEVLYVDVDKGIVRITPEMFALSSGETIHSIVDAATNKKCSVFTSQPKPPYNAGDLWFDGSDVLTCVTARKTGSYQKSDWQKKVDYIDQDAADKAASDAVSGMKQTDILNKLTNNGNDKAIYLINGKLYISFSAMRGDELTLGGSNNVNGILRVLNGSGTEIGRWDKDGLTSSARDGSHELKGVFNGSRLNFYVDGTPVFNLEPVYDSRDTGYAAFCAYKPILFVPGAGGTVAYRYGGLQGAGEYHAPHYFGKSVYMAGSLTVAGTKNRSVLTENYEDRLLYCYEMASPYFGDIGEAWLDENGEYYGYLDDIFSETVRTDIEYQVFLQKEGKGDIWVESKNPDFFVIRGTPGLKFSWEIKAKQKGFELERLENKAVSEFEEVNPEAQEAWYLEEIKQILTCQEELLYETA